LGTPFDPNQLEEQINTLLNSFPQPLDYRLWDEELDDFQKQLCAHLTQAVIERYIRPMHHDDLGELSNDDLMMMLTVPIAVAMIAQQRLYVPTKKLIEPPRIRLPQVIVEEPPTPPTLAQQMRRWWATTRTKVEQWWLKVRRWS
jgi:hypothetical protein